MSKELMAECMEEAKALIGSLERPLDPGEEFIVTFSHAVIAVGLYQERMRARRMTDTLDKRVTDTFEEADPLPSPWTHEAQVNPKPAPPSTRPAPPGWTLKMQNTADAICPDCQRPWTADHACPAAGSRGTARWPAP